jgi:hypothetical protein
MLVSQAKYARLKSVTDAAVSQWKREGRLVMIGKKVDLEATEAKLRKYSSHRSKRLIPAADETVKLADQLKVNVKHPAQYADGATYGNPANLPQSVVDIATAIADGAVGMAELLLSHLPLDQVRTLVEAWVAGERRGWVSGPGAPFCVADDENWPEPPIGFEQWCDHPLFTEQAPTEMEWEELQAELEVKLAGATP